MGFDYREFEKMRDNMVALESRSEEFIRGFLLEMALRALAKTKARQEGRYGKKFKAVDTGTMVNNWTLSEVRRTGDILEIDIFNNIEYASHVEYGHKTRGGGFVEGKFMCRLSVEEIQKQIPGRWDKAFKAFLGSLGF